MEAKDKLNLQLMKQIDKVTLSLGKSEKARRDLAEQMKTFKNLILLLFIPLYPSFAYPQSVFGGARDKEARYRYESGTRHYLTQWEL